jgi:hypothetical protein
MGIWLASKRDWENMQEYGHLEDVNRTIGRRWLLWADVHAAFVSGLVHSYAKPLLLNDVCCR